MDLIPEGGLTLANALDQYRQLKWDRVLPEDLLVPKELEPGEPRSVRQRRARLGDLHQADIIEIVEALFSGRLRALVRPPGQTENFVIDRQEWGQFFPERPFLDPVLDTSWNEFYGRTPFFRADEFSRWADEVAASRQNMDREQSASERIISEVMAEMIADHTWTPGEADDQRRRWRVPLDPSMVGSHEEYLAAVTPFDGYWTLDQALSWTMWRRADWIDVDPIMSSIMALEPGAEGPRHTLVSAASMILAILRQGLVEVTWTDAATGAVSLVPRMQFAAAAIVHSSTGHVVKVPRQDGENPLFSGHINMLRISAVDVLKSLPPDKVGTKYDGPFLPPSPFPAPSEQDEFADDTLSLGDAALWIASEGRAFSNSDERAERLEMIGVPRLLAALKRGKLRATGYNNRTMHMEPLGDNAWVNAAYDKIEEGVDIVSFLDFEAKSESGGTLTRWANHRNERPDWSRIRVAGEDLRRHFPAVDALDDENAPASESTVTGGTHAGPATNSSAEGEIKLTTDQARIWTVVQELWPGGPPPMRVPRRNAVVNGRLDPKVSERALQMFFNQILPRLRGN